MNTHTHTHLYTGEKKIRKRKNQMDNGLVIKKKWCLGCLVNIYLSRGLVKILCKHFRAEMLEKWLGGFSGARSKTRIHARTQHTPTDLPTYNAPIQDSIRSIARLMFAVCSRRRDPKITMTLIIRTRRLLFFHEAHKSEVYVVFFLPTNLPYSGIRPT